MESESKKFPFAINSYDAEVGPKPYPTGDDLIDENPVLASGKTREVLARFWIPESPAAVLGNSQIPAQELRLDFIQEATIPVYRRRGGGGAVLLHSGTVCVGIRFPRGNEYGIDTWFGRANDWLIQALQKVYGIQLQKAGISDLAVGARKLIGSSLYLPKGHALFLASILVDGQWKFLESTLRHPSKEPEYREKRSHREFLIDMREATGIQDLDPKSVVKKLREVWEVQSL